MFDSSSSVSFTQRLLSHLLWADEGLQSAVSACGALKTKAYFPLFIEKHYLFANTRQVNHLRPSDVWSASQHSYLRF